jgi:hypothetical protein
MFRANHFLFFLSFFIACHSDDPDVKNINYTFRISDDYVDVGTKKWLFISDADANNLFTSEIENGATIEVNKKVQGELMVTILIYTQKNMSQTFNAFNLSSFIIQQGDYLLDKEDTSPTTSIGKLDLTLTGSPSQNATLFGIGIGNGSPTSINDETLKFQSDVSKNPTDVTCVLISDSQTPPYYKKFKNISTTDMISFSYSEMLPMENRNEIQFETADRLSYNLNGVDKSGNYWYMYGGSRDITSKDQSVLPIYYTDTEFPQLITNLSYTIGNTLYGYDLLDTKPASVFNKINASVISFQFSNGNVTAELSGTYTYFNTNCSKFDNNENYYGWNIFYPGSQESGSSSKKIEFKIPSLPKEILAEYNQLNNLDLKFAYPSVVNYEGIDNYQDFIKYGLSGQDLYKISKEHTAQIKFQ